MVNLRSIMRVMVDIGALGFGKPVIDGIASGYLLHTELGENRDW